MPEVSYKKTPSKVAVSKAAASKAAKNLGIMLPNQRKRKMGELTMVFALSGAQSTRNQLGQANAQGPLFTAVNHYSPQEFSSQTHALEWLQHEIPAPILFEFNRRWADKLPLPEPMLYLGDRGESVIELKKLLHRRGILLMIDEFSHSDCFDPLTQTAIIRFQHQRGFLDDGIVGPRIWRALRQPVRTIRLSKRLQAYRPLSYPCQTAALLWLQSQLSDSLLSEFLLRWHR